PVLGILAASCAMCAAEPPVFREVLAGGKADPGWRIHCSSGAEIVFGEGSAEIRVDLNTFAHISRPLGTDDVTVSAKIKPSSPAGVTWCTSVFLVWNGGNWCQMGIISAPNGGPCFYAVETKNGATAETYLTQCDLTNWHYVRIQLGKDCIRYYACDDGNTWKCLRVIRRPDEFIGAPANLVVGKGYGRGVAPYPNPDLDNDYSDRGPKVVSSIADIRVEMTPSSRMSLTSAEQKEIEEADLDPVGKIELRGKDDPTYERISKYYPPMKFPKEAVGVPEHPVDIAVDHLGRLQLNYNQPPVAWIEFGDPPIPFGDEKTPIKRRWRVGYLPVLTLTTVHDGVEYEQTVFGWSERMNPDKPLYAYIRLKARPLDKDSKLPERATLVTGGGKRMQFTLTPTQSGMVMLVLKIPYPDAEGVSQISLGEFENARDEAVKRWESLIGRASHFEIPEQRVNDAYKAWIAYAQLDVDKINGIYEPHDGVGFYEENYGYSCTLHCIALDMYGLHDKAELYLDSILHFQAPDGLYTQNFGLPDMGTLLLAMAEHYSYTGDKVWLKRVSGNMIRTADWIIRKRADTPKEGVLKGLIKYRAYCDYATPVYDYFADTYCVVGMEAAV
ncbi:MAG: hypothetical protein NTU88_08370, partial [Armatimonadetes bacterium]|nr:hypothetical protein [Armatimonadota bacterium]